MHQNTFGEGGKEEKMGGKGEKWMGTRGETELTDETQHWTPAFTNDLHMPFSHRAIGCFLEYTCTSQKNQIMLDSKPLTLW